ncbi:uncharacterized protein LOC143567251 [Bidens hawaiensis]|uniref:uncharacterized protein LOC143567251 n=1 Tax=Bidens hawaiensis TaxID=980011 RepID=UPI00404ABFE8
MDIARSPNPGFFSPPHGGSFHYASAPSSPSLTEMYCGFDELLMAAGVTRASSSCGPLASIPFAWEEKPGVPKTPGNLHDEDDFSFDVSCGFGGGSVPAEDLFDGGVIKTTDSPVVVRERGRERGFSSARLSSSRARRTRSLSPLGVSKYPREPQPMSTMAKPRSTDSCENGSKRWSFKDLFSFRSASDGRAMDNYPLKKYFTTNWRNDQDSRSSSESGSVSKRRARVSPHELYYNLNCANSNELRRKLTCRISMVFLEDYLAIRKNMLSKLHPQCT